MRDIFANDENLLCGGLIGSGSYGSVFKAYYNKEKMALKKFSSEIEIPETVSMKIIELCKDFDKFDNELIIPKYVFDEKKVEKYLINIVEGKPLSKFYDLPIEKKIEVLRKAKDVVSNMNNKGIVHGDIYFANFIYDEEKDKIFILDFDSSGYGNYELEVSLINDLSRFYINYNSIDYGVDRFMFNIMTFGFLNNRTTYASRIDMLRGNYGIFNFDEGRKLCDLIANCYKCDDFLIDAIDVKKVRERLDG